MLNEYQQEREKRHKKAVDKHNKGYQKGLQENVTAELNKAFKNLDSDMDKHKKENEENSLLNTEEFQTAFNQGMEETTGNKY